MAIKDQKIKEFLDDLASKKPTPGGGAAAALAGAMGASLVSMVAKLSLDKDKDKGGEFKRIKGKAERLRQELLRMADEDCQAFERVMKAYRLPKESNRPTSAKASAGKQNKERKLKIQEALKEAAILPLRTAEKLVEVVKLASFCAREGNRNAVSDARCGIELATSGVYSALENVRINLESIKDNKFCQELKDEMEELLNCEDLKAG
jgi:formiminotetrahydrofolate cyclodeaminase